MRSELPPTTPSNGSICPVADPSGLTGSDFCGISNAYEGLRPTNKPLHAMDLINMAASRKAKPSDALAVSPSASCFAAIFKSAIARK
jgi:hypothetical protein